MIQLTFDITDCTDLITLSKTRYGYCKLIDRLLNISQLEELAKKYDTEIEIQWVYDFKEERSIPHSFIMKLEDHMYSAFIIAET